MRCSDCPTHLTSGFQSRTERNIVLRNFYSAHGLKFCTLCVHTPTTTYNATEMVALGPRDTESTAIPPGVHQGSTGTIPLEKPRRQRRDCLNITYPSSSYHAPTVSFLLSVKRRWRYLHYQQSQMQEMIAYTGGHLDNAESQIIERLGRIPGTSKSRFGRRLQDPHQPDGRSVGRAQHGKGRSSNKLSGSYFLMGWKMTLRVV